MYNQDWEDCIGNDLRKQIAENNADLQRKANRQAVELQRAEERGEVATLDDTYSAELTARDINLMKYSELDKTKEFTVKIRYNDQGKPALCRIEPDGTLRVEFIARRRAVAPGQSVVIYDGNDLVGGAIIDAAID